MLYSYGRMIYKCIPCMLAVRQEKNPMKMKQKAMDFGRTIKPFFIKNPNIWAQADKFWGFQGIFGQFIRTHVNSERESLSMFSFTQPLFLQNTKSLFISKYQILIWDLNLGLKELEIQPSCVRNPCKKQFPCSFMIASHTLHG